MSGEAELNALAEAAGVQVHWRDASGRPRTVSPDSLRAVLTALELPCASSPEMADSRRRLAERRALEGWGGVVAGVGDEVRLPEGPAGWARVIAEDGATRELSLEAQASGCVLAAPSEPGDYTLELDGRRLPLAVAPRRGFTVADLARGRRLWGSAVQVYALRGARPAPHGDFTALAEAASAFGRAGADALAISPVHALFAADPGRCSPYAPSTRLFLNVLFADPAGLYPDLGAEPAGGEEINWESAGRARLQRLRTAFDRFAAEPSGGARAAFGSFRVAGGADLEGHARFEALHARLGGQGWRDWPSAYRDARQPAVEAFAREHAAEVDFHLFLQWLADRGLAAAQAAAKTAGMALGLIADLAVGMDPNGSHAWSRPQDLLSGLSVGAPPDIYQPAGQDWGVASFSPQALRASAFAGFRATLRTALRHAGGVRIDHAIGLNRLWLTPHGASPSEGAYLTYPKEEMLRLAALESVKARAVIVGEDLGTVPEGFRQASTEAGVMGMRVLWFERAADQGFISPALWDTDAMGMTTTHDLPTVAGWWRGRDIDWRAKLDRIGAHDDEAADRQDRNEDRGRLWSAMTAAGTAGGDPPPPHAPEHAVDAALAFVAQTACAVAILPVEDLLGLEEQPNLPGVVHGHPNWRRRLDAPTADLLDRPDVQARTAALRAARPR